MKLKFLMLALTLVLSGCIVYKIDIQQGNEITAAMLGELELGMSREAVRKILGAPLVNDPFHADRWDYFFQFKKGATGEVKQQSATLKFTGDALAEIKSTLTPTE